VTLSNDVHLPIDNPACSGFAVQPHSMILFCLNRKRSFEFLSLGGFLDIDQTRRMFLGQAGASLGLLWLSALTPDLLAQAHAHAQSAGKSDAKTYRFFTPQQAADFDGFAAQIIPTDDTPGAREANVVHFTDYVLSTIDSDQQAAMKDAFTTLQEQAAKTVPGAKSFAALTSGQQIEAMKAMEKTEAFGILRAFTLTGFFCDPELAGNKDKVGWKLIGFEDQFFYKPPFGYYDAHYDKGKA
jgi:gluconate 2-dehydrogenase gamma chain